MHDVTFRIGKLISPESQSSFLERLALMSAYIKRRLDGETPTDQDSKDFEDHREKFTHFYTYVAQATATRKKIIVNDDEEPLPPAPVGPSEPPDTLVAKSTKEIRLTVPTSSRVQIIIDPPTE